MSHKADQIQPLFITVDPERDSVDALKNYMSLFHPNLIGLTGNPDQIKEAMNSYKVHAVKVQDETMNDYTIDHSSYIYFMDPEDTLIRIFKIDDTAEDIVEIIDQWIS